jgi:uncharacterized membrane protein YedE/YeeE
MNAFTPWSALGGGALIALGLVGMLVGTGRIAGISNVFAGLLRRGRGDFAWRALFVAGMLAGGAAMARLRPDSFDAVAPHPLALLAAAGFFVGVGTRLSNGCTSGHGLCGMSRLSRRSIAATGTFLVVGIATATAIALVSR